MKKAPAIIGVGRTKFKEHYEKEPEALIDEAGLMALDSAGVEKKELDACYLSDYFLQLTNKIGVEEGFISQLLETHIAIEKMRSFSSALSHACHAIQAGEHNIVLIGGIEKMTDRWEKIRDNLMLLEDPWSYYAGGTPETNHELLLRQYIKKYKLNDESLEKLMSVLAQISVKNHHNGVMNEYAHFQREINLKKVLNARDKAGKIFGLFDFAPISDGSTAIILVNPKIAKDYTDNPVYVLGSASATDYIMFPARENRTGFVASQLAMKKSLLKTGITLNEIKLAEIYDQSTILELISLEDLGFAKKGRAWLELHKYFDDYKGYYTFEGKEIFVNTDGGLKADGNPLGATGGAQIFEVFKQLRGEAGSRQINPDGDFNYGCIQEIEGFGTKVYVHILGRE
jgi:acetyl-CoA C-acetyltransferase